MKKKGGSEVAHHQEESGIIGSINITPMVDIILVLLVIFMVTANLMKKESVNINLPKSEKADPLAAKSLEVHILANGEMLFDGKKSDEKGLGNMLAKEAKIHPNARVALSADRTLPYDTITRTLGIIRSSGITRIALVTAK